MRIAVITDIHANIYALEAVSRELEKARPDVTVFLGDLVINGLYPKECLELLDSINPQICIKGNTDGFFSEPMDSAGSEQLRLLTAFAEERLKRSDIDRMLAWPIYAELPEGKIGFCHGSPFSFEEKLSRADLQPKTAEKIAGLSLSHLFFGHTHYRESYQVGTARCMNPGAVGYSFDGSTQAHYATVDLDGETVSVHQHSVEYDRARYIREIRESDFPAGDHLVHILEHGRPPKK